MLAQLEVGSVLAFGGIVVSAGMLLLGGISYGQKNAADLRQSFVDHERRLRECEEARVKLGDRVLELTMENGVLMRQIVLGGGEKR